MEKGKFYCWFLLLALCMLTACDDEKTPYPSVRLEFLTAASGMDGELKLIQTDEGETYPVVENRTNMHVEANSLVRIAANYEFVSAGENSAGVRLYGALSTISPLPQPAVTFESGVKTDPVDLLSIWLGMDYLNVVLTIKAQEGIHRFGFVEDEVLTDPETGFREVYLTLYHDAGEDIQAYTKRAYLSVPLQHYFTEGISQLKIHFALNTYSGETKNYEFSCTPSF